MATYGYGANQPFGDPNRFTRSTGDDEIDRFNQWLRTQPFWGQARGSGTGDFNDTQRNAVMQGLRAAGINLPGEFAIDQGGNINQKSRLGRNLLIAGVLGAGALTGGAALGAFGGAGGAAGLAAPVLGGAIPGVAGTALPAFAGPLLGGAVPGIAGTAIPGFGGGNAAASASPAIASAGRSRLMNSLSSPEAIASIASGGLGFASNLLSNRAAQQANQQNIRAQVASQLAGATADEQSQDFARQQAYMNTFNQNPVNQAKQTFRTAALGRLAERGPVQLSQGGGVTAPTSYGDLSAQYLSPDALAENASRFYGAAGALNPSAQVPDLSAAGFSQGGQYQGGLNDAVAQALARMQALSRQRREDLLAGISDSGVRNQFNNDYFTRR